MGYDTTGTCIDSLTAQGSCDSIRMLNLTVLDTVITHISQIICPGDTLEGCTTTGTYTNGFIGSNTCDSTRALDLIVLQVNLNPSITANGNVLVTDTGYFSYQWYVDVSSISGADSVVLTVMQSGIYSVEVTDLMDIELSQILCT